MWLNLQLSPKPRRLWSELEQIRAVIRATTPERELERTSSISTTRVASKSGAFKKSWWWNTSEFDTSGLNYKYMITAKFPQTKTLHFTIHINHAIIKYLLKIKNNRYTFSASSICTSLSESESFTEFWWPAIIADTRLLTESVIIKFQSAYWKKFLANSAGKLNT